MQYEEPVTLLSHSTLNQTRCPVRSHSNTQPPPGLKPGWPPRPKRDSRPSLSPGKPQAALHQELGTRLSDGARGCPRSPPRPGFEHRSRALSTLPCSRTRSPRGELQKPPPKAPHFPTRPKSRRASHLCPSARAGASGQGHPRPQDTPYGPPVFLHRPGALPLSPGLRRLAPSRPLVGQA